MSIGYPKRLPSKGGVFIIKTIFIKILCTAKKRPANASRFFWICVGTALSSQAVARQVFSTLMSLTSVFGMGTGGSSSPLAPTIYLQGCKLLLEVCPLELCSNDFVPSKSNNENKLCKDHPTLGQALDRLVLPSSMPHDTYTCSLSTL